MCMPAHLVVQHPLKGLRRLVCLTCTTVVARRLSCELACGQNVVTHPLMLCGLVPSTTVTQAIVYLVCAQAPLIILVQFLCV
jgi:hypothetical protein